MLSFLRLRCKGSLRAIYQINVKYAHRSSVGSGRRRHQQLWSGQGNEDLGSEMLKDVEEVEDLHDWFDSNMAKPEFQKIIASEEEKLKRKVMHKIIERKYYKKPQEIGLLMWDAKEQIRFLHNEYPNEWTVDRLAESFPVSREGVIRILKSHFQPKSLAEILKHDERVQKRWKELEDGKKKGMLARGPVTSRYQELLKSAAGNLSLPRPDLNRLLLPSDEEQKQTFKTFTFLSIVEDYCEKKQGAADTDALKQVKSKQPDQLNLLEEHLAQNRKLIEGVVEKSPKHLPKDVKPIKGMNKQSSNHIVQNRKPKGVVEQSTSHLTQNRKLKGMVKQSSPYSEGKRSDLYKTLENEKHPLNVHLSTSARQSMNAEMRPKQLIDTEFGLGLPENGFEEDRELVELLPQRRSHELRRRSVDANVAEEETGLMDNEMMDGGMQGTKKLGISEDVLKKMEANSRLALEPAKSGSRHAVDAKVKEALRNMKDEDNEQGTEVYMFSVEKGYQHPFGRRKDLPDKKIPVPRDKLKLGVEFRKGNDFYDEDGEFLYRAP